VIRVRFGTGLFRVAQVVATVALGLLGLWAAAVWVRSHPKLAVALVVPALAGIVSVAVLKKKARPWVWLLFVPALLYVGLEAVRSTTREIAGNPVGVLSGIIVMLLGAVLLRWIRSLHSRLHGKTRDDPRSEPRAALRQCALGVSAVLVIIVGIATFHYGATFLKVFRPPGLVGAIGCFLIVSAFFVLAFGLVYAEIYLCTGPRSFRPASEKLDLFDFVYYSFHTLTTVGGSGIEPVDRRAKFISMAETMIGLIGALIYLAAVFSHFTPK
jgi:hypothetical protein